MDALWPLKTAVVGVYDHPPPEGSGISAIYYDSDAIGAGLYDRELVRAGALLTRIRDRIHDFVP